MNGPHQQDIFHMPENEIKVTVTKFADRSCFVMRYVDPVTGKRHARSTEATTRREAERAAAKWEAELQEGRYQVSCNISWKEFRERYEGEKLASLAKATLDSASTAMNHLERLINPRNLTVLTPTILSKLQAKMRQEGMRGDHHRNAFAAPSGLAQLGRLDGTAPQGARLPHAQAGERVDTDAWTADYHGGVRADASHSAQGAAGRCRNLGFAISKGSGSQGSGLRSRRCCPGTKMPSITVDLSGRRPRLRIYAEAEKGHQDRLLPMTPDFAKFLLQTPKVARTGLVFDLVGHYTHEQMTPPRIGRIISDIGRRANVVVRKSEGKFASAHDLRRSFGTRWAPKVKPATLQLLMRHRSIETTLKYYVAQDADEIADELWKDFAEEKEAKTPEDQDRPSRG